ncbi:MAG: HAD family hydrolase [Thermodesulfobacteriota bacterium]
MKKYSTIIFDLFDTIVNFNFNHLPEIELKGLRSRTTSTQVYEVFRKYYPEIKFEEFYDPFIESYHEFLEMKSIEFKEFPNRDRYILMLNKMNLKPVDQKDLLIDKMVLAHMNGLASCVELSEENRRTLEYIKTQGYRTAIVSNFDYAPTAYMLLNKFEITNLFEEIIISEEVGWRKPNHIIFETALKKLEVLPVDALFVGDNYHADVVGSKAVGMDAAWINRKNEPEADLDPKPNYIIKNLSELINIV